MRNNGSIDCEGTKNICTTKALSSTESASARPRSMRVSSQPGTRRREAGFSGAGAAMARP